MRLKKGDMVKVIAGKEKNKTGKILRTLPKEDRVIVEGVNMVTKHKKTQGPGNPGGILKFEAPIHVSNVMFYDSSTNKTSRIGYKVENGKKTRVAKRSGNVIDK